MTKDTRNNWVDFMFVTKYRYNCFLKQSHINTCTNAFRELESCGFQFGTIGFAGNHIHFQAQVPQKYSVLAAKIMLKSRSAQRMFEHHPGFRKRYPRGSFWSGYEHHESIGRKDFQESTNYIINQVNHHNIHVIDDTQQKITSFTADQDTSSPRAARA